MSKNRINPRVTAIHRRFFTPTEVTQQMVKLAKAVAGERELRMVITLPRVFKDNNARMAIVYMVRSPSPDSRRKVLLAEVREK